MRERWRVYNQIMYNAKVKVVPWVIGTKHFPESKTLLDSGKCFGEVFLDSGEVFLNSGTCFVATSHRIKEP